MTATGSTRSAPHGKGGGDGGEAGIPVSLFGGGVADFLSADPFETSRFARFSEAMSQSCRTGSPSSICAELRFLTTTGGCVSIGDLVKHRLDEKELEASVLLDISRMHT